MDTGEKGRIFKRRGQEYPFYPILPSCSGGNKVSCLYTAETFTLDRLQRVITMYDKKKIIITIYASTADSSLCHIYKKTRFCYLFVLSGI